MSSHYSVPAASSHSNTFQESATLRAVNSRDIASEALQHLNSVQNRVGGFRVPRDASQAPQPGGRQDVRLFVPEILTPPLTPRENLMKNEAETETVAGEHTAKAKDIPAALPVAAPYERPSLLRYIDSHLLRAVHLYNKPPDPTAVCPICHIQHNHAPVPTSFLPLVPCGHWVHYRCLVARMSQTIDAAKDKCPVCTTPLVLWDGISALTLATRTGLTLPVGQWNAHHAYRDAATGLWCDSDATEYAADCAVIEATMARCFYAHAHPAAPRCVDGSPRLAAVYYDVLGDLALIQRPRGVWLRWRTYSGFLLFGMLIGLKLRRWLGERQTLVVGTEGWKDFEAGMGALQMRIIAEVEGE